MAAAEEFNGRVAVVTGAGSGMGAEVAFELAAQGSAVACLDINGAAAEATVEAIREAGGSGAAYPLDIRSREHVEQVIDEVERALGPIGVAVNCAGIIRIVPFLDVDEEQWDATLATNLKGTFLVLQSVARRMIASQTRGSMVAIASIGARGPRPDCADYAASKAGVISLVQSAAVALAPHGITVNAICPGFVDTPMTAVIEAGRAEANGVTASEWRARTVARIPLGRIESPADVAHAILFLTSAAGSYITGQALNVCGGVQFN